MGCLLCGIKRSQELLEKEVGLFIVSCKFTPLEDGFIWVFIRVYEPLSRVGRTCFWEELGTIRGQWEDPWSIRGDFNIIRFPHESRMGNLNSYMGRFLEVIDELDLVDLPPYGGPFTWGGGLRN